MFILKLFRAYIFSRRSESLIRILARITLISSFLSVFALILIISIMNGFNRNMAKKLLAVEPHISFSREAVVNYDKLTKDLDDIELQDFEQQDLVIRTLDGYFSGAIARGLHSQELTALLNRISSSSDNSYVNTESVLGEGEVYIGSDLARSLNVLEGDELSLVAPESLLLPAGELIPIERVRIAQIIQTDVANFDSKALLYSLKSGLPRLASAKTKEDRVEIYLEDPYAVDDYVDLIQENHLKKGSDIQTWKTSNLPLFFALRMERWAMSSLLGLSVLVTSFSLIMVLLMLVAEKRKDVGMMMAMGMPRRKVVAVFTALGFLLAGLGSLGGLFAGAFAASLLEKYPLSFMPDIYADSTLPAQVNITQVAVIAVALAILALFSAWLPVRKLASDQPAENLRNQIKQ